MLVYRRFNQSGHICARLRPLRLELDVQAEGPYVKLTLVKLFIKIF